MNYFTDWDWNEAAVRGYMDKYVANHMQRVNCMDVRTLGARWNDHCRRRLVLVLG